MVLRIRVVAGPPPPKEKEVSSHPSKPKPVIKARLSIFKKRQMFGRERHLWLSRGGAARQRAGIVNNRVVLA